MKAKSLQLLRSCALVLGWLLFAVVLAGVYGRVAIYNRGLSDPTGSFNLASALESFFFGSGGAFFALLIAAVVRMIEKQAPVEHEYARRLMIVCCLAYAADALVRFYSLLLRASVLLHPGLPLNLWFWIPIVSDAVPVLIIVFYAASIFVLYTQFAKMVMFESEVA